MPYPLLQDRLDTFLEEGINPEIYLDSSFLEYADPRGFDKIREEFGKRDLTITVHGPYADLNPGSTNEDRRLLTVKRYRQVFEAAKHLRPRSIVLHAGYNERKYKGDKGPWLEQSLKTWPEFVKMAEDINMTIAAENIFERVPETLKDLVDAIGSPNFGVCIDSGHLNVFSKVDIEEWFMELGPDIAEVHLHDNSGKADDHLPIGEGQIDFERFFSLLRKYAKDPVYTIEPHGEEIMRRAIKAIRKYL